MSAPNRAPWRIQEGLERWPIRGLVMSEARILVCCEACEHWHVFQRTQLSALARMSATATLADIAPRLRCTAIVRGKRCRSEWVRIELDEGCKLSDVSLGAVTARPR